jgi:hypothetical protein
MDGLTAGRLKFLLHDCDGVDLSDGDLDNQLRQQLNLVPIYM